MTAIPTTIRRGVPMPTGRLATPPAEPRHTAAFWMFLLVNAFLFLRPSDIYEPLYGVEVYQYVIGACLILSLPALIELFSGDRFGQMPIVACIMGLLPVVFASSLVNVGPEEAFDHAIAFAKIVVYFLLLVALVTTSGRLKVFLSALVFFAGIMAILSILDFSGVIELIRPPGPDGKPKPREPGRMMGPGLFGDPNDVCSVLVTMLILGIGLFTDKRSGSQRALWLIPCGLLGTGFVLTQSRGGLIAFMVGAGVFIRLRFGWGRAIALGALGFPVLLLALGTRQTSISSRAETATQRIQLWSSALVMFKAQPVLGGGYDQFVKRPEGLLTHNAYLQWYAELGFLGGSLFVGATVLSLFGLYRLTLPRRLPGQLVPVTPRLIDPGLRHYHPYVAGAVTAYCTGMFTLSLNYMVSTYTIFGLAAAFLAMSVTDPPRVVSRFGLEMIFRLAVLGVVVLAVLFVFVRLTF